MKKIYLLLVAATFTIGATAQKTTKKAKSTKTVKTTAIAKVETPKDEAVKTMDSHGHDASVHATTAATDLTPKPVGEDNLQIATSHDFGKIPQGKPVTTEFVIKNIGKGELKLDQVQAGCGCTTPTWQPGPYKAGEEAKITVGYNAAAAGSFTKPVTITYNGGLTKVINITGEVVAAPPAPAPDNKAGEILKQGGN